jgi:hypothetical protein
MKDVEIDCIEALRDDHYPDRTLPKASSKIRSRKIATQRAINISNNSCMVLWQEVLFPFIDELSVRAADSTWVLG